MHETILIINEEPGMTVFFRTILSEHYKVIPFESSIKAIDWIWDNPEKPNLFIVDIDLKHVKSLEIIKQLRECYGQDIPLIITSGNFTAEEKVTCGKITDFTIEQPITVFDLERIVHQALESAPSKQVPVPATMSVVV